MPAHEPQVILSLLHLRFRQPQFIAESLVLNGRDHRFTPLDFEGLGVGLLFSRTVQLTKLKCWVSAPDEA